MDKKELLRILKEKQKELDELLEQSNILTRQKDQILNRAVKVDGQIDLLKELTNKDNAKSRN